MGSAVQNGSAPPANALSSLQKVNVASSGETASPTTSASITANLPSTATPIAAANLPSANSATSTYTDQTSLVVYDNLGGAHTINVYLANTGANTWEVDAYDASTASAGGGFPYSSGPLATGTLTYSPTTGALSSGSPLSFTVPGGQTMNLDLSNTTQLAASFSVSAATVNGNAPASLQGVSIASNGTMSFNYTNGASVAAYDIPLANVASPDFLTSVNGNAYEASASSGPVFLSSAGAGSMGSIESSSLEKLDGRSRHRTHRHDPGAERLRSQFQGLPDGRHDPRRPQRAEAVTLSAAFNIISSSFAANAAQTAVVSNNVANANTPGYSREIANVVTNSYGGADVASVTRVASAALTEQVSTSTAEAAAQQAISNGLATLAATVDDSASASSASGATQNGASPSAMLANLQSALTTYEDSPTSSSAADAAVTAASQLAASLNSGAAAVDQVREQADQDMASSVATINSLLSQFTAANNAVVTGLATGANVASAEDQRDSLVTQLSQQIGVTTTTAANGSMSIYTDSGVTLFQDTPRTVVVHADRRRSSTASAAPPSPSTACRSPVRVRRCRSSRARSPAMRRCATRSPRNTRPNSTRSRAG